MSRRPHLSIIRQSKVYCFCVIRDLARTTGKRNSGVYAAPSHRPPCMPAYFMARWFRASAPGVNHGRPVSASIPLLTSPRHAGAYTGAHKCGPQCVLGNATLRPVRQIRRLGGTLDRANTGASQCTAGYTFGPWNER